MRAESRNVMMGKRNWRTTTICVVLIMLVLVFETKYSLMVRFRLRHAHGKNSQGEFYKNCSILFVSLYVFRGN